MNQVERGSRERRRHEEADAERMESGDNGSKRVIEKKKWFREEGSVCMLSTVHGHLMCKLLLIVSLKRRNDSILSYC